MKNYFEIKDNTIDKKFNQVINKMEFKMKEDGTANRDLNILSDNLLTFYADMFFKSSKKKAKKSLDAQHNKIRTKDAMMMTFFLGATMITLICFVFFLLIPQYSGENDQW